MIPLKNKKIADIVSEHNATAQIFDDYHLDYCTTGEILLKEDLAGNGIDFDQLIKDLQMAIDHEPDDNINFNELSIPKIIEVIRIDHHEYLRSKISELTTMSQKFKHEKAIKNISRIQDVLLALFDHLAPHMLWEEKVLFPYLEYMEHMLGKGKVPKPPSFGKVKKSVMDMLDDHKDSTNKLDELRKLSGNFTLPKITTKEMTIFFKELKKLDKNLRMHIHLENNVLFTKARTMAEKI